MHYLWQKFREETISQKAHAATQRIPLQKMSQVIKCKRFLLDLTRALIPNAFYSIEECFFSRYYRDCQTYENLLRHVCVAPPQQPVKRVKKILDLGKGPDVIAEHLKELEQITKKGGTIKAGKLQIEFRTKNVGLFWPMSEHMIVNRITHIFVKFR